ncbi:MAG TPA: pantoate--beta-alanine ligase [Pseudonocardiaceae bacterium]|nr:pantoate--beta-alanine ligase [Pseudonocardiaceae bacterium]
MSGPQLLHNPAALAARCQELRRAGRVALVPTMGALHDGHRTLIRAATAIPGAATVVSIFVNPRQFESRSDFDRYPRQLDADLAMCREEGVELVFAPAADAMCPQGSDITVVPGPLGAELEGISRPGHFTGVLTIVAKLFGITSPDLAFFGEKDYQQLVLVQRMVAQLWMAIEVIGVPTVRDTDGLALSSRNARLSAEARAAAAALPAALAAGTRAGAGGATAVLGAAQAVLASPSAISPSAITVDYLELRDPRLGPAPARGPARLLLAATVGGTRLIDNMCLRLGGL